MPFDKPAIEGEAHRAVHNRQESGAPGAQAQLGASFRNPFAESSWDAALAHAVQSDTQDEEPRLAMSYTCRPCGERDARCAVREDGESAPHVLQCRSEG